MASSARAPGLDYVAVPAADPPSPLRTDVAGFIGRTRRGPDGVLVRVTGWRGFVSQFGDVVDGPFTPYAIRGYFNNGGKVAHVLRVVSPGAATATATLRIPPSIAGWGFASTTYSVSATSKGSWGNGATLKARFLRRGVRNTPELEINVAADGERPEYFTNVAPEDLADFVNAQSSLIALEATGPAPPPVDPLKPGPQASQLDVTLAGGSDGVDFASDADRSAHRVQYVDAFLAGVQAIDDEEEVALVVAPDLHNDAWLDDAQQDEIVTAMLTQAAALHDRLVLLDAPWADPPFGVAELVAQAEALRALAPDATLQRSAAFYHPWLEIPLEQPRDPLHPYLRLPPSGHVAGVISRLDRERGAHHTPANAPVIEATDVVPRLDGDEQVFLHPAGVNLVRCIPGRGLMVWGSRTLDRGSPGDLGNGRFIAHRRLVHRLVRAARRVAEPLVFDVNGPELWLALVRALTSVLLESFRAGALQGARPEEAFYVKCDAQTNSADDIDNGRCICEVGVAPAKPMEFIILKVALLANGTLEVVESEAFK